MNYRSDHLHLPTGSKVESSSETDDADREVAEMTKFSSVGKKDETQERGKPIRHDNCKLFAEMEESIAMLLEYGQQHIPKPLPRKILSREKVTIKF
uniref:Uncharacterized protein n=1 Tax=Heterorhabditis bacteriophora TaxID=37862 RepID=A0A1I7XBP0_HETBA